MLRLIIGFGYDPNYEPTTLGVYGSLGFALATWIGYLVMMLKDPSLNNRRGKWILFHCTIPVVAMPVYLFTIFKESWLKPEEKVKE